MSRFKKIAGIAFIVAVMGICPSVAQNTSGNMPQQSTENVEVSDAELAKFAKAYQNMRMINQEAQQKMMKSVKDGGFEIQRFNEIHQASMDPNKDIEMTDEEKENHEKVVKELEGMQAGFQKKMEKVLNKQGMTMQRYEQLAKALQSDKELQNRLREMMQS